MIRRLFLAGIVSALATLVGALSVRASGVVLAVGSIAAVTVLATWLCSLHSTDEESGLALANPAWALGLTLTRRFSPAFLVPVVATQIIGAVIAGAAVLGLQSQLPDQIIWSQPNYTAAVAIAIVLGILGIWILFGIDQQLSEPYAAIGPLLAGGVLPIGLASVLNPAVMLGMAIAGILSWPISILVMVAVFAGTIAGTLLGPVISPAS